MITEHDLQEAIAECQGKRNPDANTCIKLAAFYTIRNELYGSTEPQEKPTPQAYSYAGPEPNTRSTVDYYSDTELSSLIDGKNQEDVWPIIDELITALRVLNPRLYDSFMDRIQQL